MGQRSAVGSANGSCGVCPGAPTPCTKWFPSEPPVSAPQWGPHRPSWERGRQSPGHTGQALTTKCSTEGRFLGRDSTSTEDQGGKHTFLTAIPPPSTGPLGATAREETQGETAATGVLASAPQRGEGQGVRSDALWQRGEPAPPYSADYSLGHHSWKDASPTREMLTRGRGACRAAPLVLPSQREDAHC